MARQTRSESQARTRAELLDTARGLFLSEGYARTSLERVAEEAGYSKGAVYSNFRGKEGLFLAVIRDVAVPLDLGPDSGSLSERLAHAAAEAAREVDLPASRRLLKLQLEFALLTMQDPALLREFVDDIRTDREELAGLIAGETAPAPAFRPSPEQLATAITAALQGLQQHRFLDPVAVPEELAGWAVQALLHVALRAP